MRSVPTSQRAKVNDINTGLLDMFGIPWQNHDVVGVTLRMRGGRYPTLTIHRKLPNTLQATEVLERFELHPIEPKTGPETDKR